MQFYCQAITNIKTILHSYIWCRGERNFLTSARILHQILSNIFACVNKYVCVHIHTHTRIYTHAHSFHYMPGKGKMWMPKSRHCQQQHLWRKELEKQYNGFGFGTCLINWFSYFIAVKKDSIKVDNRKKDQTILFRRGKYLSLQEAKNVSLE